jgi:hypothetical protein
MKTIKFYEIPNKITSLEFDGDKTDLRLHYEEMTSFSAETEEEYNVITKILDKFQIQGNGWLIVLHYDVSGYDYWVKQMGERNYIGITIHFENEDVPFDENDYMLLDRSLNLTDEFINDIRSLYAFDPSENICNFL